MPRSRTLPVMSPGGPQPEPESESEPAPSLPEIVRQWGRIGCIGFGGPPTHVALFRELCVRERQWLTSEQFERAIAATNLLPGPSSTQLAIYCAWRLRGYRGALLGGLCFILPGLIAIIALAAVFLSASLPTWLRGAGMGAGAAVAAVAVRAGAGIAAPIWARASDQRRARARVLVYGLAGGIAAALAGAELVIVLLACGLIELARQRIAHRDTGTHASLAAFALRATRVVAHPSRRALPSWPLIAAVATPGDTLALTWTALKIGALAFGGGFVIVPLMQADAVSTYHWMSHSQFLNAVALGQLTPGPLVQTVAVVGYAAAGLPGALLAGAVAFAPSFSFILLGAQRFERMLVDTRVLAFLAGAAPSAAGAIIGAAVPLAGAVSESWQYAILAAAAIALLVLRRAIVPTLLLAACAGAAASLLGAPTPH